MESEETIKHSGGRAALARCQRLLAAHQAILRRHRYLLKQLTSLNTKLIEASQSSHVTLEPQLKEQLNAVEQWILALQKDKWLDKLFSIAVNSLQVQEIENLMGKWGQGSYDSVAHCIVDHANRHGFRGQ